ncbi:MAG: hypothetical protein Q7T71_04795 [Herbiconiux sp.]|nr:hypothetical protein [Herbiconiux sp.]
MSHGQPDSISEAMSASAGAPLHAWVDESIHVGNELYLLAAAVAPHDAEQLETCRLLLRSLARRPRRRLHWNSEEERDRLAIVNTIAEMPLTNVVVTATRLDPRRQERARRKCLQRMLHHLAEDQIEQVWLESRDAIGDSRDLAMVASLRTTRALPASIRVDHARPLDEPLLWIPDAVAGAVAAAHNGQPLYRNPLARILEEVVFEL